ncbi:50S ribosomal protein L10 [Candidatus Berkelbacteria bacterium]|nr:50S ribosomal protein L10 [Candidatus Berkelbacteria bacterium]
MAKTQSQKADELTLLQTMVKGKAIVFTAYRGVTVKDLEGLRTELRKVGGSYRVTKNTLLRKALEEQGIAVPGEVLDVQLGIASSQTDEVEPNRVVVDFQKRHETLGILGAVVDGKFIDPAGVKALAALPSREQLYGQLVGTIAAPLTGIMNVLSGNIRGLVTVLNQYQLKQAGK